MQNLLEKTLSFQKKLHTVQDSLDSFSKALKHYLDSPENQRMKKVKRNPLQPKKPNTSYIRYFNERRPELLALQPELEFEDIGRMIGIEWKSLSKEKKDQLDVTYKSEMLDYKTKMLQFEQDNLDKEVVVKKEVVEAVPETAAIAKPDSPKADVPAAVPAEMATATETTVAKPEIKKKKKKATVEAIVEAAKTEPLPSPIATPTIVANDVELKKKKKKKKVKPEEGVVAPTA